ncbi:MAG: SEC-C domain-containing protein [Gammaproteobacteria bacterium]|nr:SEC-C domain-containing protein [Gammaproteobacteria bacterium]
MRNGVKDGMEQALDAATPRSLSGDARIDSILQSLMECLLQTRDPVAYFFAVGAMTETMPDGGGEMRAGLQAMARKLWNATPLPWEGFRCRALPKPERNEPCPCGSGRKFKQCCRNVSLDVGFIVPELTEMLLARHLQGKDLRAAESARRPLLQLAVAQRALEEGHPGRAKRMLTGLLEKPLKDDLVEADAIDVLGAVYRELGQIDAGIAAMRRLTETRKGAPASAAYGVLSTMAFEDHEPEVALRLARLALDESSGNPFAGVAEIQALLMLDRLEEAEQRLTQWREMSRELGDPALVEVFEELAASVAELEDRLRDVTAGDPIAIWQEAIEAALREPLRPVMAEAGPEIEDGRKTVILKPDPAVDAAGQALFEHDAESVDALTWLQSHPLGMQSPDAVEHLLETVPPGGPMELLHEHRNRLVEHWLAQVSDGALLPWAWFEHRGLLRAMFSTGLDAEADDDADLAIATFERLLALEPEDHQGARLVLVNLLLKEGRDEQALAWMDRFPGEYLPEMAFGRVLVHARRGEVKAAEAAFRVAHAKLPHVFPFLKPAHKKPPKDLRPGLVRMGGKDQAWFYREDMRACFARERGLLQFMDGIAKRMREGR